jgi:hypothetical protein
MLIGTGVVSAAQPGWTYGLKYIPGDHQVAPDKLIAYTVTVKNKDTSRSIITGVNLDTDLTDAAPNAGVPKYVSAVSYQGQPSSGGSCSAANTTRLMCQFGTLQVGGSATVTVAFQAPSAGAGYGCDPASSTHWCFNFRAFGNGNTSSDGGTSHGDYLLIPTDVFINGSSNFAGGFFTSRSDGLETNPTLGRSNQQATAVTLPGTITNTGFTVEDGSGAALDCKTPSGKHVFGECSAVDVAEGTLFETGLIKITIMVYGGAVPGGVAVSDIIVIHTKDDGTTETLATCTFTDPSTTPNNAPCAKVTKVGGNYKIEIWTPQNGGYRGGFN